MECPSLRSLVLPTTWLLCLLLVEQTAGANQVAGLVTSEPTAALVKHFVVPAGSVIVGVEFVSNDDRTIFPRVAVLSGRASRLSEAAVLAEAANVRSVSPHRVRISVPPIVAEAATDLYVAITFPASDGVRVVGDGAGIGASQLTVPSADSYIATTVDEYFQPIDLELEIELVLRSPGKTATPENIEANLRTFLGTAAPNPATSNARIEFGLERRMSARLAIYSVSGRLVRLLAAGPLDAGVHALDWDGNDHRGQRVAAGVYIAKLQAGEKVLTQKMVLAK